jgi:hypothetical protein
MLRKPQKSVVIVQKLDRDYKSIKNFVNKNMSKSFSKMFFIKPKSNEVECESITLCYESFLILNAKHHLEYYKNRKYSFNVDNNVAESIIFGHNVEPVTVEEKFGSHKEIVVEAKELVIHESTRQLALDRKGRPINPKNLPSAKTESNAIEFLDSYRTDVRHLEISIPEILKKQFKKRPEDVTEIIDEHLEITSQVLIYTPIFEARCRNTKSHEIKIIPVSGVTGNIFAI